MVSNIWVAAADNQVKIVESHLDSGMSPNSKDPNGYTAIHAAASYGHLGLLRLLLSRGGDVNIQDDEGDTPLHHCEDVKTARIMIEQLGADFKIKNNEGQTPLQFIEDDGEFPELVAYLKTLEHGGSEQRAENTPTTGDESVLSSLPSPGNVDGHNIRYTLENEDTAEVSEERRRQIEAIVHGDNPEEALRELVTSAVHEGMAQYRNEPQDAKRRK